MACAGSAGGSRPPHGNAFRLPADCEDDFPKINVDTDVEQEQQPHPQSRKKKQGERGHAKGLKLAKVRAKLGGMKVPLQWDERFPQITAKVGEYGEMYTSELGQFVKSRCKPYVSDWAHVDEQSKNRVWRDMEDNFNPVYEHVVKHHASIRFRNWKNKLKTHAITSQILPPPRPSTVSCDEDWELFLRRIDDPDFQRRCQQNAANRARQKYPSLHGRMPLASHRHKNKNDSIATWEDKHKKHDSFVNQAALENFNKLKTAKERITPGTQQPTQEQETQIFQEALGRRPDYSIGLGRKPTQNAFNSDPRPTQPETSRIPDAVLNEVAHLREENTRLKKSKNKFKNAFSSFFQFAKSYNPNFEMPSVDSSDDDGNGGDDNDDDDITEL